jgi:hypothetical protein
LVLYKSNRKDANDEVFLLPVEEQLLGAAG